jgi:O-antigen/teichoic acid export membrane protein
MVIVAPVAQFGFPNVIVKYFPSISSNRRMFGSLIFVSFAVIALMSALIFLLMLFFRGQIVQYYSKSSSLLGSYLILVLPLIIGQAYMGVLEAYCATRLRVSVPTLIREILIRGIWLGGAFAVMRGSLTFYHFILLYTSTYLIAFVFQLGYAIRQGMPFSLNLSYLTENKEVGKQLNYAFALMLQGFLNCLYGSMDVVLVGALLGDKPAGIYVLTTRITALILIPQRVIVQLVNPLITEAWYHRHMKRIQKIFQDSWLNLLWVGLALMLVIWLSIDDIIASNPDKFEHIKWLVFIGGVAKLIDVASGINTDVMCSTAFYHQHTLMLIGMEVTTVILGFVIIPEYGLMGAVSVFLFSVIAFNVSKLWYLKRKANLSPFVGLGGRILVVGFAAYGITWLATNWLTHSGLFWWLNAGIKATVFGLLYMAGLLLFKASPELIRVWEMVKTKIKMA